MQKKYVIANWKMNPLTLKDAENIFNKVKRGVAKVTNVKTIICPPYIYLGELLLTYSGTKIAFGAQDSFFENKGSFTGEVSPYQLYDLGADYVILGHSERRASGETNEIVNKKVKKALAAGLSVILCVGESQRDERGEYLKFIEEEIKESLRGVGRENLGKIILAYEPVWAIGGDDDDAVSPRHLHQMKLFVLKILNQIYGARGLGVPVIYGGSAEPENVKDLLGEGEVDGFLVGHASLIPQDLVEIIKAVSEVR